MYYLSYRTPFSPANTLAGLFSFSPRFYWGFCHSRVPRHCEAISTVIQQKPFIFLRNILHPSRNTIYTCRGNLKILYYLSYRTPFSPANTLAGSFSFSPQFYYWGFCRSRVPSHCEAMKSPPRQSRPSCPKKYRTPLILSTSFLLFHMQFS